MVDSEEEGGIGREAAIGVTALLAGQLRSEKTGHDALFAAVSKQFQANNRG